MISHFPVYLSVSLLSQRVIQVGVSLFIQSAVIIGLAMLVAKLLSRGNPAFARLVYRAALAATVSFALVMALPRNPFPSLWRVNLPSSLRVNEPDAPANPLAVSAEASARGVSTTASSNTPRGASVSRAASAVSVVVSPRRSAPSAPSSDISAAQRDLSATSYSSEFVNGLLLPSRFGSVYSVLAAVWLAGIFMILGWLGICNVGVRSIRRRSEGAEDADLQSLLREVAGKQSIGAPDIRISGEVRSVFLLGILRPVILLPSTYRTDFDSGSLRAVLAHEAAHIANRDAAWSLAARLVCAVGWFNPLLWLLLKQMEEASEMCCDLAAVSGGCDRRSYVETLVRIADRFRPTLIERAAGTGIVGYRSSLGKRVQKLMSASPVLGVPTSTRTLVALGALCAALACGTLVSASALLTQEGFDVDKRLDRTVAISAEGISLSELFPIISKKTGVALRATREMADEKIVILGPGRSFRGILSDVAALYNAHWVPEPDGSGNMRYVLTKDLKTRRYEEQLADANNARFMNKLQELVNALNESPEMLAKRAADDPIRKSLSSPASRNGVRIFSLLTTAQRQQMIDSWSVRLSVAKLDDSMKSGIEHMFHGEEFQKELPGLGGLKLTEIPREEMDKHEISFDLLGGWGDGRSSGFMSVMLTAPVGFNLEVLSVPSSAKFALPAHGNPYTGEEISKDALLPLSVLVDAINDPLWVDKLKTLTAKSGAPVVADYYRSKPIVVANAQEAVAQGSPALMSLDNLCRPAGYLWWNRGTTLLLRKRDWYNQRQYEVPDWWVLKLAASMNAHGGVPTYGDVLALLDLSIDQLVGAVESAGGVANRKLMMGAREYLAAVRGAGVSPAKSIENGVIRDAESARRASVIPNLADPLQRKLLADFESISGRQILRPGADPSDVGYMLMPNFRPGTNPQSDSIQVSLNLYLGKGSIGAGYLLFMPLKLPDDRRDKTVVDLTAH